MKFNRIKLLILILIVTIIFLLNGCASTPKSPFKRVETIPEEHALVYVYVTKNSDFMIVPLIQIGENLVSLSSYTYYPLYIKPDRELRYKPANFFLKDKKERIVKIELKPDKTYYLRCKVKHRNSILECTVVPPEIGEKEIVKCKLGQLCSGKEYDVPYELMHEEELTHEEELRAREKAVLYTYKPLRARETPSISILTPGEKQDVVGLRKCQCYKLYTRPGEIQYTKIFTLDPNSYNYKFDVEAGRRYYIKDSIFPKVVEPEIGKKEINNCIKLSTQPSNYLLTPISGNLAMEYEGFDYSIYAQVISKLDREEIKKVLTKKDKIGLVWLCENNTAKIYKTRSGGVAVGAGSAAGVVASNPGAAGSTMSGSISGGLIAGGVAGTVGLISEIAIGVGNIKLSNRLKEEKVASLVKDYYLDAYRNPLTSEGFKVKIVKNAYNKEQLKRINEFGLAPYDFKPIAQELQIDHLIVLDIRGFGVVKKYKTFSLADKPKGYSFVEGYLVEGASNRIISKIPFETQINVEGEWDTPPDFSNLVIAGQNHPL